MHLDQLNGEKHELHDYAKNVAPYNSSIILIEYLDHQRGHVEDDVQGGLGNEKVLRVLCKDVLDQINQYQEPFDFTRSLSHDLLNKLC